MIAAACGCCCLCRICIAIEGAGLVLIGFKLLAFAVWKPDRQRCCAGLGRGGSRATLAQLGRIRADKVPRYPVT